MKTTLVIAISLATLSVYADGLTSDFNNRLSVSGNPIGQRDNYTINSDDKKKVELSCTFENSGNTPADLFVWTNPTSNRPLQLIHLSPGTRKKPYQIKENYTFKLQKAWWCRIYTPHKNTPRWQYCAYLSVSDATIREINPFTTWDRSSRSRYTHYSCQLTKSDEKTSFFYFRR